LADASLDCWAGTLSMFGTVSGEFSTQVVREGGGTIIHGAAPVELVLLHHDGDHDRGRRRRPTHRDRQTACHWR
jgi:hypothetical protein